MLGVTRHPAAFINEIAEHGDKAEAITYLQQTWDELWELRQVVRGVVKDMASRPPERASEHLLVWYTQLKAALEK